MEESRGLRRPRLRVRIAPWTPVRIRRVGRAARHRTANAARPSGRAGSTPALSANVTRGRSSTAEPLASTQTMRVRLPLPAPCCLRLLARIPAFQAGGTGSIPVGSANSMVRRETGLVPRRLTAGHCTLNAGIVVRIHAGEPAEFRSLRNLPCSAGVAQRPERRSHTAKVGCSNQPAGTSNIPAVVQWSERLIVAQVADGSTPSPGTIARLPVRARRSREPCRRAAEADGWSVDGRRPAGAGRRAPGAGECQAILPYGGVAQR